MHSNWFRELLRDILSLGKNNQRIPSSIKTTEKHGDYAGLIATFACRLNEIFSG